MVPPACQSIVNDISALNAKIKSIKSSPGYLQGGKPNKADLAEVKSLLGQVSAKKKALDACLLKNVAPFPIKMRVSNVVCLVEQEGGFLQDDEPYVLVAAVNLAGLPPSAEVTLYGPWADVNSGESVSASGPLFWSLDGKTGAVIAKPENVVFMVGFMENDDGEPTAQRGIVKSFAVASLAASINMPRAQVVSKLAADMQSAMAVPTGGPDSDDRIGAVQELVLAPIDLVRPVVAPYVKTLKFSGNGASYQVSILLTQ